KREARSTLRAVLRPYSSAVGFNQAFDDRKSESKPFGSRSPVDHAVEQIEEEWQGGHGNAGPVVAYSHRKRSSIPAHLDPNLRVGWGVLGRILDQVVYHFTNFDWVQQDGWQRGGNLDTQSMIARHRFQSNDHVVEQRFEVLPAHVWSQAAALNPRQVQQVAYETVESLRLLLDSLKKTLSLVFTP